MVTIVLHGSRKPSLQDEVLVISRTCAKGTCCRMWLEPEWIPREENMVANYLSRLVDTNDCMLNPLAFNQVNVRCGLFTINKFADAHNAQLPKFNSQYWSPGIEVVDTFIP